MKITHNCRVFLRRKQVLLRVRWTITQKNKPEVSFCVGVGADESKWDKELGRAKYNTTHSVGGKCYTARQINGSITRFLEAVENVFKEYESHNCIPTKDELKNEIDVRLERNKVVEVAETPHMKNNSLNAAFEEFLKVAAVENTWGPKTHHKYKECISHLKSSIKSNRTIFLNNINKVVMTNLKNWYIINEYSNATIVKHFRNLRTFLRWASKNDYEVNKEAFDFDLKISAPKKVVTFLTREELDQFSKYIFPEDKKYLERVRDGFCFMSYTSLRYSDLAALKMSNVRNNGEYLELHTQKTKDLIRIPLIPQAKELLDKYSSFDNPTIFPVCSNQKMNDYLKEAAELAGLDRVIEETRYVGSKRVDRENKLYETISCHDARRTFVCNSLSYGIPASVVSKCTGHSDLNSMRPYIATADGTVAKEMKKWVSAPLVEEIDAIISKMDEENLKKTLEFVRGLA